MKFYLLTFNEDWADEHDVPALACMNESQYQKWLGDSLIYPNPDYEMEYKEWSELVEAWSVWREYCRTSGVLRKSESLLTEEENETILKLRPTKTVNEYRPPKKGEPTLHASLGNSGQGFGEDYMDYKTNQGLVDARIVKVFEVDQAFKDIFDKAGLSRLSLANVFEG